MRRIGIAIILTAAVSIALRGQTPRVHQFVPEKFYTTYSFAHPPALHINPGDRVVTKMFRDSLHGGKEGARRAARKFKRTTLRRLPRRKFVGFK